MTDNNPIKSITQDIDELLGKNPQLKEAMDIFNISNEEYKEAMASISHRPAVYSSNTTSDYGDLERNS